MVIDIPSVKKYPVPTVDVGFDTMVLLLAKRPDITDLYAQHMRPDGRSWFTERGEPDVRAIVTDWWTNVAGINDAPDIYGNSLARWYEVNFGIAPLAQPGANTVRVQQVGSAVAYGEDIPYAKFVAGGVLVLATLFFLGRREKQLTYVPDPRARLSGYTGITGR